MNSFSIISYTYIFDDFLRSNFSLIFMIFRCFFVQHEHNSLIIFQLWTFRPAWCVNPIFRRISKRNLDKTAPQNVVAEMSRLPASNSSALPSPISLTTAFADIKIKNSDQLFKSGKRHFSKIEGCIFYSLILPSHFCGLTGMPKCH